MRVYFYAFNCLKFYETFENIFPKVVERNKDIIYDMNFKILKSN